MILNLRAYFNLYHSVTKLAGPKLSACSTIYHFYAFITCKSEFHNPGYSGLLVICDHPCVIIQVIIFK